MRGDARDDRRKGWISTAPSMTIRRARWPSSNTRRWTTCSRERVLEHELRVLRDESNRVNLECQSSASASSDNQEKIKLNKQLRTLVGNVVELLDMAPEEEELEDQATTDVDAQRQGKAVVLKTTTRQTIFLPVVGHAWLTRRR